MAIRWSSLHEQLGETPRALDYSLIESAVNQGVAETDALDWKKTLPGKDEVQSYEFAKDLAAMANTRGGLIVYGVAEERGTGRAKEILGVEATEPQQRRLRMLAATRINPLVPGLELTPLTSPDGEKSVLVLAVPRSPDAPHILGQENMLNKLGVPYRAGPETQWMRERDIERAYSERFSRREDETHGLAALVDEVRDQLESDQRAWIVAAARPRTPLPTVTAPPTRDDVRPILETALRRSSEVLPGSRLLLIRELGSLAVNNPRVGLRRWVVRTTRNEEPDALSTFVHVELHHDGSVVFACALEGWFQPVLPDKHHVHRPLVESFAADFAALAETYALRMGGLGSLSYRLDLSRQDPARPLTAVDYERYGPMVSSHMALISGSREVRRFIPVVGEMPTAGGMETLRDTARTAAADVLHQFGVGHLVHFSQQERLA
ncbi:helix-turn-helix domain-containing protein [Micromonospora sp. NPDC000442]|uniref:AlbA family DNA-binding domain-containing protein n=1 Tax=Micromonospora sp. NPDC000442 TaxID=3364217 RepID=UPI0036BED9E3